METITKSQALEIFCDNLDEILFACKDNLYYSISKIERPQISKIKSAQLLLVKNDVVKLKEKEAREKYEPTIRHIEAMRNKKEGDIDDMMIQRAKEYPIATILNVTRKGNISCPFHQDKTPSLSIKNNRFKCFSCQESGDSIDLYMKLNNTNFNQAVKALQ